ncbi:hypothetical protein HMPREF1039_0937 [Megasphaera lornae]|uniref:4Fe-4S ferredoxin-type domain-containing protein n=1 Tax=Megasphaera lornae TaxID=1000568 RepID=A0ABN0CZU2_9FIRM|nr:hypothetical protein [Megasphaera lornae]EGL39357.1 hypothetical protein HMPREF1039_0937 [Megasphaera lornae]
MKIGIKYCGGCNCHYDRTAAVKKMIKKWPNYTYSYTPETEFCDHCFIICGCPVACPETAALRTATWEKITSPRQLESAVSRLEKKQIYLHRRPTRSVRDKLAVYTEPIPCYIGNK